MKKFFTQLLVLISFFSLFLIRPVCSDASDSEFVSLNPVLTMPGSKYIYVQHDENNNNVYDLKKSGTGKTVVYREIYPRFTPASTWTTTGEWVKSTTISEISKCGSTSPNNYISVKPGEVYFTKLYGVHGYKADENINIWTFMAPIAFFNDNNEYVGQVLSGTFSKSKGGVEFTVPEGATRMHITMYNNQSFTLQKKFTISDKTFDSIVPDKNELLQSIDEHYETYKLDRTVYKKTDKAYITFVNDDTRSGISNIADLFISKQVPLVLATIPEALIENSYGLKETRLKSVKRIVAAGGEVMVHNGTTITADNMNDYGTMYASFIKSKKVLENYGFEINGIILAGGLGLVYNNETVEKWGSAFYSYSDLYGIEYDKKEIALDSTYYHWRTGMANYQNNLDKLKASVDNAIANNQWLVFYFHEFSEISEETLGALLDYVNSKCGDDLEIVTYKEMYEKNAIKESELFNNKTYYVSATGTSAIGDDSSNPMSFETARNKTFISGDTILFKRGDIFYGSFSPKILKINDASTTISSYGKGELPVFTSYKIVSNASSWEKYSDDVWRVSLKDLTKFSGYTGTDYSSNTVGFVEYGKGEKLYTLRASVEWLEYENNFCCDGSYFYIKTDKNPYYTFGTMKLATKVNLILVKSNSIIDSIKVSGTGAHGILNADTKTDNVIIRNCIIENIGGSYLKNTTRYGNGIEFYETDVSNVVIENNIIRNVYDVGFTIQGNAGSGTNVHVSNNVFVNNTQDSEIWESGKATGVNGYHFSDNISINQGRGWGYEARPDKYAAGHILFWGYNLENTDITFYNNTVYNPKRLYYIEQTNGTNLFFKNYNYIKSDYNTYYMASDTTIFRDEYKRENSADFINAYKKDMNSHFEGLDTDSFSKLQNLAVTGNDISAIKSLATGSALGKTSVVKATTKSDGKIITKCSLCSADIHETVIKRIKYVTLASAEYTYTGSAIKPSVTVKDSDKKVINASNYTVTYSDNKYVGTATVTVKFKGNYSGTVTRTFRINPKQAEITSLSNASNGIIIRWNSLANVEGYKVFRRTADSDWKLVKTISADVLAYRDKKAITGGTEYIYTVVGYNTGDIFSVSTTPVTKSIYRVGATTINVVYKSTGNLVTWDKITEAAGYRVYRRTVTKNGVSSWKRITTTTNCKYTDTSAKAGYTYEYNVRAITNGTLSAMSNTYQITCR